MSSFLEEQKSPLKPLIVAVDLEISQSQEMHHRHGILDEIGKPSHDRHEALL